MIPSDQLQWEQLSLPCDITSVYQPISCLKTSSDISVWLIRDEIGQQRILKITSDPLTSDILKNEQTILSAIHAAGEDSLASLFPVPLALQVYEDRTCYLRSYIPGRTLAEICEEGFARPWLSESLALNHVIQLTEQLCFLHHMSPPILHRDIKPQNIVMDEQGQCRFIDMGISRFYEKGKSMDTLVMGTPRTAPPEQFGYCATDCRSDIYSMGILLLYLVSGEYEPTEESMKELSEPLRQIIRKATMFDPDKRYQSADQLLAALLKARYGAEAEYRVSPPAEPDGGRKKRFLHRGFLFLATAAILTAAAFLFFRLGQSTALHPAPDLPVTGSENPDADPSASGSKNAADVYTFTEPLIEKAVRLYLDKPSGDITYGDLALISSLHIMGQQIYFDDSEVWLHGSDPWFYDDETRASGLYLSAGSISSLEDITHMPNLTVLCLYRQQISDISALEGTEISYLGLGYNPLTDLSPLEGNSAITSLVLADMSIDSAALPDLPRLTCLNITATNIRSLAGLKGCPLTELYLYQTELDDYRELQTFDSLQKLELSYLNEEIMDQLAGLPLSHLAFYYSKNFGLEQIRGLAQLRSLTFFGDRSSVFTVEGEIELPQLEQLTLTYTVVEDFDCLASLPSLHTLSIYGADCTGYEGLDHLSGLHTIACLSEQAREIDRLYPGHAWILLY